MTVSTTANQSIVSGDGANTVFNFSFIAVAASYIEVIYTDADGVATTLSPLSYSIVLNAASPGQIWGIGGTVTYPLSGSPIASGTTLTISRILPLTQTITIANQGDFAPEVIEEMGDTLEMQIQQISGRTGQIRGTWITDTDYTFGDVVQDGANGSNTGNFYMCAIANTSDVWADDLEAGDWSLALPASLPVVSLPLVATNGGTGTATVTQGDVIYGSAANVWSKLAKDTNATRSLTNTGSNNSPAWAQVDLTTGVSGVLPAANGGGGGFITPKMNYGGYKFDGSTNYLDTNALTGIANGKKGTLFCIVRFANAASAIERIVGNTSSSFTVTRTATGKIQITGEESTSTSTILSIQTTTTPCSAAGQYAIFGSWDLGTPGSGQIYVQALSSSTVTSSLTVTTFIDDNIDYTQTEWAVGATTTGGSFFTGDIYSVWLDSTSNIDFSVEANRQKFVSSNIPVFLGPNGELPTGTAPILFLGYGAYTTWPLNRGTGVGTFTQNGTPAAVTTTLNGQYFPIATTVVRRQEIAVTGTYTPNQNLIYADVEIWGGGGGGGGVTGVASAAAGGGGAGGYSKKLIAAATIGTSQVATIGAGGTAGANTGTTGGTGGTTSVGVLITATGGLGGVGNTSATTCVLGGAGGLGASGDINATGMAGGAGGGSNIAAGSQSGFGGSSNLGGNGGAKSSAASVAGAAGVANSGSGASGAASAGSAAVGGVGGSGYIVITEYCWA